MNLIHFLPAQERFLAGSIFLIPFQFKLYLKIDCFFFLKLCKQNAVEWLCYVNLGTFQASESSQRHFIKQSDTLLNAIDTSIAMQKNNLVFGEVLKPYKQVFHGISPLRIGSSNKRTFDF